MKLVEKIKNLNFNFARSGKKFIIAPAVILLVALLVLIFAWPGFNLGLDFTGGSIVSIDETNNINKAAITEKMEEYQVKKYTISRERNVNGKIEYTVKFNVAGDSTTIIKQLTDYFGSDNVHNATTIAAQTSKEKIMTVFWSILAACAGLMVYMLFRFKFTAGITTLLALGHDVLMICSLMIIFQVEINSSFIAALLTVIAYSINNSLVIFDRVRDMEKNNTDNLPLDVILNKSINRTLGRCVLTIITTLATLVTLTIISIAMSLPTLIQFAIPIIIGLVVGTYSSIFLIAPMYHQFERARLVRKQQKSAPQVH